MPRSVTPPSHQDRSPGLGLVGYVVAAGALLLSLAPFIAILWLFDRVRGENRAGRAVERVRPTEAEPSETDPAE